eukprot:664585-Prymnesium_polylepis.2
MSRSWWQRAGRLGWWWRRRPERNDALLRAARDRRTDSGMMVRPAAGTRHHDQPRRVLPRRRVGVDQWAVRTPRIVDLLLSRSCGSALLPSLSHTSRCWRAACRRQREDPRTWRGSSATGRTPTPWQS